VFRGIDGNSGAFLLTDRSTGRGIRVTAAYGTTVESVEEYEVAVSEV
jgi:hypothetical protein